MLKTWQFIKANLEAGVHVILLYVVASEGSSPGRKGFVMAVNEKGIFQGTIGGGMMEVKLIELAKHLLKSGDPKPLIKQQYHDKQHVKDQSGLICSGAQTVVLMPILPDQQGLVDLFMKGERFWVRFSNFGFVYTKDKQERVQISSDNEFEVVMEVPALPRVLIFGGGHVGTALAKQMSLLDYQIQLFDDRENVFTMQEVLPGLIRVIDYAQLEKEIDFRPTDRVVIVTFSYRTDKLILRQLYPIPFAYIGMMGSEHKIATLKRELMAEGIRAEELQHIFFPIGVDIYSKTANEIAVSIAAQIIREINRQLPTGRTYKA